MTIQVTKEEAENIIAAHLSERFNLELLACISTGDDGEPEIIAFEKNPEPL